MRVRVSKGSNAIEATLLNRTREP